MKLIIPTIFAHTKKQFNERLKKLLPIAKELHIDFMDVKFVKAKGVNIEDITNLKKYRSVFEAHLIVMNPSQYVLALKKNGFKKIIFHYEAVKDKDKILGLIYYIKNKGMKAIIAINPETIIDKIKDFLHEIDGVLLMGVYPGKEKQEFISGVYNKIKSLRKINKKIIIQIDGGVNISNIKKLNNVGVNYINSGSFINDSDNPKKALKELEKAFNQHQ